MTTDTSGHDFFVLGRSGAFAGHANVDRFDLFGLSFDRLSLRADQRFSFVDEEPFTCGATLHAFALPLTDTRRRLVFFEAHENELHVSAVSAIGLFGTDGTHYVYPPIVHDAVVERVDALEDLACAFEDVLVRANRVREDPFVVDPASLVARTVFADTSTTEERFLRLLETIVTAHALDGVPLVGATIHCPVDFPMQIAMEGLDDRGMALVEALCAHWRPRVLRFAHSNRINPVLQRAWASVYATVGFVIPGSPSALARAQALTTLPTIEHQIKGPNAAERAG